MQKKSTFGLLFRKSASYTLRLHNAANQVGEWNLIILSHLILMWSYFYVNDGNGYHSDFFRLIILHSCFKVM